MAIIFWLLLLLLLLTRGCITCDVAEWVINAEKAAAVAAVATPTTVTARVPLIIAAKFEEISIDWNLTIKK